MPTIRQELVAAQSLLVQLPAGRLEAEILLAHCLEAKRSYLYANPERELGRQDCVAFRRLLERRLGGEPIAYITGWREFWSLPLEVTPDVLIPRPETELLVERALELIPRGEAWRVADLGTGSGAIAIALASERPRCEVFGVDCSPAAVELAGRNAERLGLQRVRFITGSWCKPLQGRFQLILSNPPYVAEDDPHLASGDCRFEPTQALTPGPDALAAFRAIALEARDHLEPGGHLLLEHGPEQGESVRGLLRGAGYLAISTTRDLLGHERVTQGRTPGQGPGPGGSLKSARSGATAAPAD